MRYIRYIMCLYICNISNQHSWENYRELPIIFYYNDKVKLVDGFPKIFSNRDHDRRRLMDHWAPDHPLPVGDPPFEHPPKIKKMDDHGRPSFNELEKFLPLSLLLNMAVFQERLHRIGIGLDRTWQDLLPLPKAQIHPIKRLFDAMFDCELLYHV